MSNDDILKNVIGKTIAQIDSRSCNIWYIKFADGTMIEIVAEAMHTQYGSIATLECNEAKENHHD